MGRGNTALKPDIELLKRIQPYGGITFKDTRYITSGGGYEACIHVYQFPGNVDDFWLGNLCNIANTIVTIDLSTDDVIEVKKNLNKSLKEQSFRYKEAKDYEELSDAEDKIAELTRMFEEIKSMGEVVKLLHVRIFVADRSWKILEEKCKSIMTKLETEGFYPTIFLNETKSEWMSMYQSYTRQKDNLFTIEGPAMTANAVAAGNPFHFSSLNDKTGSFLGKTPCGGNVFFDLFYKTLTRLSYNFLCFGKMGSGKSTLLKKQFDDRCSRGDFVRVFDISGEFRELTYSRGGKVIKLDGQEGILNPLEILKAGDTEELSFVLHISKMSTFYKFLVKGKVDTEEIIEFEELLKGLYQKFGLYMVNGKVVSQITGLKPEAYPTFSDYLAFVNDEMEKLKKKEYDKLEFEVAKKKILIWDKIRSVIYNIVSTYGNLFDGHTSIENILDEQIITFDISTLKDLKAEIFDALIINMISLCWDNCVTNGRLMLDKLKKGEITIWDVIHTVILIDESHRWINANKLHALELITTYMREARKYFAGIGLASQSVRDYVPEGVKSEGIDKLKLVFELTQYKFLFRQDSNALPIIHKIFAGVLTPTQISGIPNLQQGNCILSLSSEESIELKIHLTKEEEAVYNGGV